MKRNNIAKFGRTSLLMALGATAALSIGSVAAQAVTVYPNTTWTNPAGENGGGGSSAIVATTAIDADGSVQLNGDRTRFITGNIYPNSTTATSPGLGLLDSLTAYNFEFSVAAEGSGVVTAQAPALRLHVYDPSSDHRVELIWEDGEQSSGDIQFVNGAGSLNTVYTGDFFGSTASRVYAYTGSNGRGLFDTGGKISGSDSAQALSYFQTQLGSDAFITGLSVGVGSSVGSAFQGYADHISLGFNNDAPTTTNFAVPEPASLALIGLGGLAFLPRRRRKQIEA